MMGIYLNINPVALRMGPLAIHWYGIMYVLGFAGVLWYSCRRGLKSSPPWSKDDIMDLIFFGALGVIFGGTLGYLLFYDISLFWLEPLKALRFWEGGRSFHGGLIGVILALFVFSRIYKRRFWTVTDFIAPAVPIGLMTGRLGNFINGELWGRTTERPWGMVFEGAGPLPRHPSQLYELALEGIILFIILNVYARTPRPAGAVSGLFLVGYGLFRFAVEFVREPDLHQGLAYGWLTKGQLLSLPMIGAGVLIMFYAYFRRTEGR